MADFAGWRRSITSDSGLVVPNAQIEVFNAGLLTKPTLYADPDGSTPLSNPFDADDQGFAEFYVAGGFYRIEAGAEGAEGIWDWVAIGTAQSLDIEDVGLIADLHPVAFSGDHTALSNIGSNTHAQIDAHIGTVAIHRELDDAGTSGTVLWSAAKITTELNLKADIADLGAAAFSNAHGDLSGVGTNTHAQIDTHIGTANIHAPLNDAVTSLSALWSSSKIAGEIEALSDSLGAAAFSNDHADLDGIGTNTHAQIDTHIANTANPHSVTKAQVGLGDVDNVSAAALRDRATHTGAQAISTVTGLQTALDAKAAIADLGGAAFSNDHGDLDGVGTNTHAQIDSHIADAGKHREINDSGTGVTDLFSASKINTELALKADAADLGAAALSNAHGDLDDIGTNTHAQIDTHIANADLHRVINDDAANVDELWSASKISAEISAVGVGTVASDISISGDGSAGSPLSIANGGVTHAKLSPGVQNRIREVFGMWTRDDDGILPAGAMLLTDVWQDDVSAVFARNAGLSEDGFQVSNGLPCAIMVSGNIIVSDFTGGGSLRVNRVDGRDIEPDVEIVNIPFVGSAEANTIIPFSFVTVVDTGSYAGFSVGLTKDGGSGTVKAGSNISLIRCVGPVS